MWDTCFQYTFPLLSASLTDRFVLGRGFWYLSPAAVVVLSRRFQQIPICPSKDVIERHMPKCFCEPYDRTRIILDCTEIFIETPSHFKVQSESYSNYMLDMSVHFSNRRATMSDWIHPTRQTLSGLARQVEEHVKNVVRQCFVPTIFFFLSRHVIRISLFEGGTILSKANDR